MEFPSSLEQSILRTLCWFSVFDRPITGFEIWKWLIEPDRAYELSEVHRVLSQSVWLKDRVIMQDGYVALRFGGQGDFASAIAQRSEHYLDAVKKFRKLKRAVRFFRLFKNVRAIFAVNSIAWWDTNEKSDIDLFIATSPNRVWSVRFALVSPFIALGKRPGASDHDPFCFSFFASQDALRMESLQLKTGDHYFAFWLKSMVPLVDQDGLSERIQKENAWAHSVLPNAQKRMIHPLHRTSHAPFRLGLPAIAERVSRVVSRKRFPLAIRQLANKDSRVVISDEILKFHETDRRAEFEAMYQQRVQEALRAIV